MPRFRLNLGHFRCHNPSLGLATKARGCKVASQEGRPRVMPHAPGNARECEGIDLHTPNGTPTLGVGVLVDSRMLRGLWILECSKSDHKGQNSMD